MIMDWQYYESETTVNTKAISTWFMKDYVSKIPLPDNCVVLDVGCGSGKTIHDFLLPVLPKGATLYAVDVDRECIKRAKETYPQSGVRFMALDAMDLPQMGVKFDLIVSMFCIHYITDQVGLWKSLTSVLNEAGTIMLMTFAQSPLVTAMVDLSRTEDYGECLKGVDRAFSEYLLRGRDPKAKDEYQQQVKKTLPHHDVIFEEIKYPLPLESRRKFFLYLKGINNFNHKMDSELEEKFLESLIGKIQEVQLQAPDEYSFLYDFFLVKVKSRQTKAILKSME